MNVIDNITPAMQFGLKLFARDMDYRPVGALTPSTIRGFKRGLRSEDTFAGAMQQDQVAVVDAAQFLIVIGSETPRRLDRCVVDGQSFTVEAWRGSPAVPPFVFFKLLLRGSQQ
jgi:hypothetical protein